MSIREITEPIINVHPKECVFAPGAVDSIVAGAPPLKNEAEVIDYLAKAIRAHEIYCPHEGIDRRAEFGAPT